MLCSALQLAARSSQVVRASPPTTGGRRLGRADAVIAQEGQGDPESFAQFWVTSRQGMQQNRQCYVVALVGGSCDFVWFQGGSQCACWLVVAFDHVASAKSGVM